MVKGIGHKIIGKMPLYIEPISKIGFWFKIAAGLSFPAFEMGSNRIASPGRMLLTLHCPERLSSPAKIQISVPLTHASAFLAVDSSVENVFLSGSVMSSTDPLKKAPFSTDMVFARMSP